MNTGKCVVSAVLEQKIRWLCDKLPNKEWSGIMFYDCKEYPDGKLDILVRDFCLLDIGTGGYTEFMTDYKVFQYQFEHNLMDCYWGLIHSHNNFSAFFSGQDTHTLDDMSKDMNRFLSLIVNNAGQYVSAITRISDEEYDVETTEKFKSFEDSECSKKRKSKGHKEKVFHAEYIPVERETPANNDLTELAESFKEIEERKAREEEEKKAKQLAEWKKETPDYQRKPLGKQISLWDDLDAEEPIHTQSEGFDSQQVKQAANIIVSGILTMTSESLFDIYDWLKNPLKMDRIFRRAFKNPQSNEFNYYLGIIFEYVYEQLDIPMDNMGEFAMSLQEYLLAFDMDNEWLTGIIDYATLFMDYGE